MKSIKNQGLHYEWQLYFLQLRCRHKYLDLSTFHYIHIYVFTKMQYIYSIFHTLLYCPRYCEITSLASDNVRWGTSMRKHVCSFTLWSVGRWLVDVDTTTRTFPGKRGGSQLRCAIASRDLNCLKERYTCVYFTG